MPREGIDAPLIHERSLSPLNDDPELLEQLELETRALADLPPPFRRIIAVSRDADSLQLLGEHFIGVSGRPLMLALWKNRRLLPIEVWLSLADTLCRAWASVPPGGLAWHMVPTIDSFGVDVRRRVVVFPAPEHSMPLELRHSAFRRRSPSLSLENDSPEHAPDARGLDDRSRVFSLATVLAQLLTFDRPFAHSSASVPRPTRPRWRPENHPDCSKALGRVLSAAMELNPSARPATIESLRLQLMETAGCVAASPERVGNVVIGADFFWVRRGLARLRADPELLPPSWREGGLDVLEDQLLEALVPLEQLPHSRAPVPVIGPSAPPRVNLAGPPRRAWWEAIWPFRRS